MSRNRFFCWTSLAIAACSSFSLIASTVQPYTNVSASLQLPIDTWSEEDLLSASPEGIDHDSTLLGHEDALIADQGADDLSPPSEEGDSNIEEQNSATVEPELQPDIHKVLYDPKMNYGTGAPVPQPTPITTVKRNLIVLGTSAIVATIAMLVVASNKGLDAPHNH